MKICIDEGIYNAKPPKRDIARINNRIIHCVEETDIYSLATQIVQPFGRSWTSAYFKPDTNGIIERTNACWAGQTVFALDFDNSNKIRLLIQV